MGLEDRHVTPELLRNVDFSFSMFCHNRQSYLTIREQGERDLLSGLYNRNRFEMDDSMEELVRAAEKKMYAEKREYYQQASHDRRSEGRLLLKKGGNDNENEDQE